MKYKSALVTGGAGFIGSHIVDALIRRRIKVYVVDDLSSGQRKNVNPNATFIKCSITSPEFSKILRRMRPEIVFHCAAQINVRCSVDDPPMDARTNILGTLAVAHAAAEAGVKKVIFSSSGGAMFSDSVRPPYSEKTPAQPISPYGISKRAAEMYLEYEHLIHGLPTVSLRYANVYGPRQNSKGEAGVISIFAERMVSGKPVVINGTGTQSRDFVYIDDVVRANMLAMQKRVSGIYHIGTGKETSVNTLFKKIRKLAGVDIPEHHGAACLGEVMRSSLDARKARRDLGWVPEIGLDEGLKRTVEWMRKQ